MHGTSKLQPYSCPCHSSKLQPYSCPCHSFIMPPCPFISIWLSYLSSQCCNLSHHKLGFCVCGSCNLFWRKKNLFFTSSSISYPHCRGIVFLRKNKMTVLSKNLLIFTSIKLKGNYVNDLWVIQPASCVKQSSIVLPHSSSAFSKGSFLLCSG